LVIERNNKRASGHPDRDAYGHLKIVLAEIYLSSARGRCVAVSLERGLVHQGFARSIIGYDVASGAIEEARRIAKAEELSHEVRDLEREGLSEVDLDIVFAQSGLHHLARLEECFDSVHAALRRGGVFHVHEYVGPDRFQWTDRQLAEINPFLDQLPERYRRLPNGGLKPAVRRPTIQEMLDSDRRRRYDRPRSSPCSDSGSRSSNAVNTGELSCTWSCPTSLRTSIRMMPMTAAGWPGFFDREDRLLADGLLRSDFTVITVQRADHWGQKIDGSLPPFGHEDGSATRR
jgi:SAM-dependent methyltransferase